MTLTEALSALVAAGKIKSAWLPGMRDTNGVRVLVVDDHDGVPVEWAGVLPNEHLHRVTTGYGTPAWCWEGWRNAAPDLSDPATLGCLLALAREAWGQPTMVALHCPYDPFGAVDHEPWCINIHNRPVDALRGNFYATESEAIEDAIIIAAEMLEAR